jgi:hypothetical protein
MDSNNIGFPYVGYLHDVRGSHSVIRKDISYFVDFTELWQLIQCQSLHQLKLKL